MNQEPQDTNSSRLTHNLLNDKNYLSWARAVTLALSSREKLEYIIGEDNKPKPTDSEKPTEQEKGAIRKWQTQDHKVMTLLFDSMESSISDLFFHSQTSRELWNDINTFFSQQQNHSHIFRIKQEIEQEKMCNKPNTSYYGSLKKKFDELRIYRPFTTNPTELRKRIEEDELFHYLTGLDSSYENIRSQMILGPELPTLAGAVAMIGREESRRLTMGGPQPQGEGHETQAFAVRQPFFQKPPFSANPNSQI